MAFCHLLREVDGEEGDEPPGFPILPPHLVEPPVLPRAPLPTLPPEVVVREPDAPHPRQPNRHSRPRRVRLGHRVAGVIVDQHHRDHRPIQIDQLQRRDFYRLGQQENHLKVGREGK